MSHEISLAVWDLPSPVVAGRNAKLKVGVSCPHACNLSGTTVDVYNETGERIGAGTLGSTAWPATTALYWAEVDLVALEREGDLSLSIHASAAPPHAEATCFVNIVVSRPPEHRVTVHVAEKSTGTPVADVELRLGRFRMATNHVGMARVEVPPGTYELNTWKNGYEIASKTVVIGADTTIHLELAESRKVEQPYWM